MIRVIKTDHYLDPKCSPFGIHVVLDIRYMTNDSKLRCHIGVLGLSMTSIIVIEFFLSLYGILATFLYFDTCILELKIGIDHGLQLANDMSVFIGVLAHFMAIFSFFLVFLAAFLCYFGTFVGCFI